MTTTTERMLTTQKAIAEGIAQEMERDETVLVWESRMLVGRRPENLRS